MEIHDVTSLPIHPSLLSSHPLVPPPLPLVPPPTYHHVMSPRSLQRRTKYSTRRSWELASRLVHAFLVPHPPSCHTLPHATPPHHTQASEAYLAGNLDEAVFYYQEAVNTSEESEGVCIAVCMWRMCVTLFCSGRLVGCSPIVSSSLCRCTMPLVWHCSAREAVK